jgi:membrane associated rhomboid family serine protease
LRSLDLPVSLIILVLTSGVSVLAFVSPGMIRRYAESPYEIVRYGRWHQLFTSGFLHADLGHLLMNMITLYYFGPAMESVLGGGKFLILYLGSMLAGSLLTLALRWRDPGYRAVGASGAISGVLFSFVVFRPLAPIYLFLIPIGIPAVLFAVGYVAISVAGMKSRAGRIGHEAHLGGAAGGLVLTVLLYPDAVRIFFSHFR